MGGDPHFSMILHDQKQLCYSVQGRNNSVFNLVSCTDFLINAKFVADYKREGVTWMESIGIVINEALHYGGSKVTHFKFDAKDHTVFIGDKIILDASTIKEIAAENRSISIVESRRSASPTNHPAVRVHLKDLGLHFTVTFENGHLDMTWHSSVKRSSCHGLIGELLHGILQATVIWLYTGRLGNCHRLCYLMYVGTAVTYTI